VLINRNSENGMNMLINTMEKELSGRVQDLQQLNHMYFKLNNVREKK